LNEEPRENDTTAGLEGSGGSGDASDTARLSSGESPTSAAPSEMFLALVGDGDAPMPRTAAVMADAVAAPKSAAAGERDENAIGRMGALESPSSPIADMRNAAAERPVAERGAAVALALASAAAEVDGGDGSGNPGATNDDDVDAGCSAAGTGMLTARGVAGMGLGVLRARDDMISRL
jgi:hypothetical protein